MINGGSFSPPRIAGLLPTFVTSRVAPLDLRIATALSDG